MNRMKLSPTGRDTTEPNYQWPTTSSKLAKDVVYLDIDYTAVEYRLMKLLTLEIDDLKYENLGNKELSTKGNK